MTFRSKEADHGECGARTVRQQIIARLGEHAMGARELSQALGISEKEVYRHLVHVSRSLKTAGRKLVIRPFGCRSCGYRFRERKRFSPAGRCPRCRSSHLERPVYAIC